MNIDVSLTPTELVYLGVALNDRIEGMDQVLAKIRRHRDELGAPPSEDEETVLLARSIHVTIARKIEQALDLPWVSEEDLAERRYVEDYVR